MNKIFFLPIVFLTLFGFIFFVSPNDVTLVHLGENLWLVSEDLPDYVEPNTVYRLYHFLQSQVEPQDSSPLSDFVGKVPLVLRFVPIDSDQLFPDGTEGFAALSDTVIGQCTPNKGAIPPDSLTCQLQVWNDTSEHKNTVLLAVVGTSADATSEEQKITIGLIAHELAHLLGAIDGPRCPAHENYDPCAQLLPDPGDTYWYYGVQGVFTFTPAGLVWDALNGTCADNDSAEICSQLEQILSGQ